MKKIARIVEARGRRLADMEEAVELCRPYAAILGGTLEIDVRVIEHDDGDGRA